MAYYDFNKTTSFKDVNDKYNGKYFWKCDAGYTDAIEDGDTSTSKYTDLYDVLIYNTESECNSDQDGRYAIDRVHIRSNTAPNYMQSDSEGIIK